MDAEYGTLEGTVGEENQIQFGTGNINKRRLSQLTIAFFIGVTAGMALLSSSSSRTKSGNLFSSSSHAIYKNYNISDNGAPCNITAHQIGCLALNNLGVCSKIADSNSTSVQDEPKEKPKKHITEDGILHFLFFNFVLLVVAGFAEPLIKWHFMHHFHIAAAGFLALFLLYIEVRILFF